MTLRVRNPSVFVLQCLALLGLLYHLLLVARPDDRMVSRPLMEDAFYSLSVSRSIGAGNGFTVDGVHPTNGVQPLVCLIYAPLFTIAGDDTSLALRLVLLCQVIFYAATAFAFVGWWRMLRADRSDDDRLQFWLLSSVLIWNYSLAAWILNGLETGLALAIVFAAGIYYQKRLVESDSHRIRSAFLLGSLLGLGVLARIDVAFLVPAFLAWHLLRAHLAAGSLAGPERNAALVRTLAEVFVIGATSVAISAPWWIFNLTSFGSLLPISGQAQKMLNPDRAMNLKMTGGVISDSFLLNVHVPMGLRSTYWYIGGVAVLLLLLLLLLVRASRRELGATWRDWVGEHRWSRAIPLLLFAAALTIYYSFFFGAPHFQFRYLVLDRLLIFGAITTILLTLYNRATADGRRPLLLRILLGLYFLSSGILLLRSFTLESTDGNLYTVPADWIRDNVRPEESVAMFQSGTTAFLFPRVVNLDGKVNADALAARQSGTLTRYVDSASFDYIIDWDMFTGTIFSDRELRSRYAPIDTLDYQFIVWKRIAGHDSSP